MSIDESRRERAVRLRRVELATPASNEHMFDKARASGADMVFLDLEDAVAPHEKVAARAKVVDALTRTDWATTIRAIRMNAVGTRWAHGDLIEVVTGARNCLDVVVIPKVTSARDVWWVATFLDQLEDELGLDRPIALEVLIEEVEGLIHVEDIARASPRVEALIFGAGDYSASQGARVDAAFRPAGHYPGDIWHYARSKIVVAARAAGIDAIDAPYPDFHDADGYQAACEAAAVLGYVGKWAIHPSQIPIARAAFTPTQDEIHQARRIITAYENAEHCGMGATALDGTLVDVGSVRIARNILRRAGTSQP